MVNLRERDKPAAPDNPFRFLSKTLFGGNLNQFPDHIVKCLSGFPELMDNFPRCRAHGYPLGCAFLCGLDRIVSMVSIYFLTILTGLNTKTGLPGMTQVQEIPFQKRIKGFIYAAVT
jgi:hypothetical protein